jgi:hypothetical protein
MLKSMNNQQLTINNEQLRVTNYELIGMLFINSNDF